MKTLLKNAEVVNVFSREVLTQNVLLEEEWIIGVGDYTDQDADVIVDLKGKTLIPGLIDGHIHIESTMLTPYELCRALVPHGTTAIVADPHEIANVCGQAGIEYILESSRNLPVDMFLMMPGCVPSTPQEESGAVLKAADLEPFYDHERVLGLAEMMNYPGVLADDPDVLEKIQSARSRNLIINGHAPLLSGRDLDVYVGAGIRDDHECSSLAEACERIRKGQQVMIRQGTAARNLEALLDLFDDRWYRWCMLVCDDRHPRDLLEEGHIDAILRQAQAAGKNILNGICMATINTAQYFRLYDRGAIAPGWRADLVVLSNLEDFQIEQVYKNGRRVYGDGHMMPLQKPCVQEHLQKAVQDTFHLPPIEVEAFRFPFQGIHPARIIEMHKGELLTDCRIEPVDFDAGGVDLERDLVKLAVFERHHNTGHHALGLLKGSGLKKGALASSVAHDSHNLIVLGVNDQDMALAARTVSKMGGGLVAVEKGQVLAALPLPVAGLMSDLEAAECARLNEQVRQAMHSLGVPEDEPLFMHLAFLSLPVIPFLKLTTRGLIDVQSQSLVSLVVEETSEF